MTTLTDRYIFAVQRSLPEAQRADIDRELRGTIADAVDAKIEAGSKPDAAEREALLDLGDPYKLAWGYADRPLQLIGPALFPDYVRLLRLLYVVVLPIVVASVTVALLLANSLDGDSDGVRSAIGGIVATAIGVAVHLGFWTTLVFAVLERTTPQGKPLTKWDPATLPQLPVKGTIRPLDTGAALVWLALYIAALVGQQFFSPLMDASGDPLPVLNPALWSFWLPFFIVLAVFEIIFALVLHRARRWTLHLAALNTALVLAFAIPAVILLRSGDVITPAFAERLGLTELFALGGVVTIVLICVTVALAIADIVDGFAKALRRSGGWPGIPDLLKRGG
jgi:hypothetical protein